MKKILQFFVSLFSAMLVSNFIVFFIELIYVSLFLNNDCSGEAGLDCVFFVLDVMLITTLLVVPFVTWFVYKKWSKKIIRIVSYISTILFLILFFVFRLWAISFYFYERIIGFVF